MNKDVLLIILMKCRNKVLYNISQVNTYFNKLFNDEILWRNKLWKEYEKTNIQNDKTWKYMYFLKNRKMKCIECWNISYQKCSCGRNFCINHINLTYTNHQCKYCINDGFFDFLLDNGIYLR